MTDARPYAADDADPASLASQLLSEMRRGLVPVWPTTERFAHALGLGLTILSRTRGPEVAMAVCAAPSSGPVDWDRIIFAG